MSKEAMKLALDALDEFCELGAIIRPLEVRDALRKALAEQPAYRAVKTYHAGKPVYVAEQPAQEPAAWYRDEDGIRMYYDTKYWADSTPLYTSPPLPEQEPVELCQYGQEPASCTSNPMDCQCAIDAALAQPEQEPVAWLEPEWGEKICPEVGYEVTMTEDHPRDLCWVPLYPHPAQRTWVGLTDEEFQWVYDHGRTPAGMMEMVEAKLKELNQ